MKTEPQIFRIDAGDPNGFVVAQFPAVCYGKDGSLWVKTNDTYDARGWEEVIAAEQTTP